MRKDIVIFLGAGASRADGAPLQNEILEVYFNEVEGTGSPTFTLHEHRFREYYTRHFGPKEAGPYPTLEEVLGFLSLSKRLRNGERALLEFDIGLLLTRTLAARVTQPKQHTSLVQKLVLTGLIDRVAFISTNYDLLIDSALREKEEYFPLNYGHPFSLKEDGELACTLQGHRKLLKLHGSLNWMHCSHCDETLLFGRKGFLGMEIGAQEECWMCGGALDMVIVPPSYFKEFGNAVLRNVWRDAAEILKSANQWLFVGYSFPDADIHIKSLLKDAQVARWKNRESLCVKIFNTPKSQRSGSVQDREEDRYRRFLGSVNYDRFHGFEDLATDPAKFLSPPQQID